ncbi:MAG: exo-alpha-sialidase [Clostridia bacterium]|nr:exo-alpha-sialidase [Clostridia bacterium]
MNILQPPKTIVSNPDSVFGYFAWPSVARLSDGRLAAVCSGFRLRHICPFGKAVISYSCDDGDTWSLPAPVIDTPLDDRDSGICVDGERVIVTSFNNTPEFQKRIADGCERDGDKSPELALMRGYFGTYPEDVCERFLGSTYRISRDGGLTFGVMRRSPVSSPHGPMKTKDGRILWIGKLFDSKYSDQGIALCELDENEDFRVKTLLPHCADGLGSIHECEPHAIELPDGKILVAIRAQRSGEHPLFTVFTSESRDGGKSFTTPRMILPELAGSPPHLLLHSSGAVILVYACRHGNRGIRARISRDGGGSFGEEIKLTENAPSADLGYPATVEKKDGSLLTVFYEKESRFAVIKQIVWET